MQRQRVAAADQQRLTQPEQAHLASALVFELSKVETVAIRSRVVGHLRNIDEALAKAQAEVKEAPADQNAIDEHAA